MSNEIKEKEEYEKYARDHRKELDAQEVRLGDVVTVLVGQFAGEKGVIVGISACHNDYSDPYYEVDMNCEVPEKYKCRRTLISPNNVIGGLSAHEFKVIGNCAPKQPSMKIKKGDTVRVSRDIPQFYLEYNSYRMFETEHRVVDVNMEDGFALLDSIPPKFTTILPIKYLVKVDAEAKEAKFKVGDKVKVNLPRSIRHNTIGTVVFAYASGNAVNVDFGDDNEPIYCDCDCLEPYTQPTEQTEAEKKPYDGISEETANEISDMLEAYAKALSGIADSFDWQRYEADLAKEVALKVANKYNDPKEAAEYAVSVAKAVVEGLKRK